MELVSAFDVRRLGGWIRATPNTFLRSVLYSTRSMKLIRMSVIIEAHGGTFVHPCLHESTSPAPTWGCGASAALGHCSRRPMWIFGDWLRPNPRSKACGPSERRTHVDDLDRIRQVAALNGRRCCLDNSCCRHCGSASIASVSSWRVWSDCLLLSHIPPAGGDPAGADQRPVTGPRESPDGKRIAWQLPCPDTVGRIEVRQDFPAPKILIRGEVPGRACWQLLRSSVGGGRFRAVTPNAGLLRGHRSGPCLIPE